MYCFTVVFIKILTKNTIIFEIKAVKLVFLIGNINLYQGHRFAGRSKANRDFLKAYDISQFKYQSNQK
jgi:hypothetical protein